MSGTIEERAKKVVGDYMVKILGYPSLDGYARFQGKWLVEQVEAALLAEHDAALDEAIRAAKERAMNLSSLGARHASELIAAAILNLKSKRQEQPNDTR